MTRRRSRRRLRTTASDDLGTFRESIRFLRSNLGVALTDIDHPAVAVTSANAGEGKTLICSHLAMSFAQAGRRVVLVDVDLRHPTVHQLVGGHNEFGVSDVLLGRRSLDESLQCVELGQEASANGPGLYFLATGPLVTNPTELLGSGRTSRLLEGLAGQADLVLLDTPPVLAVADTLVIGRIVSGALIVSESRRTALGAIQKAKDLLIRNQTRILGIAINKFDERDAPHAYGYGYGYGDGSPPRAVPARHQHQR